MPEGNKENKKDLIVNLLLDDISQRTKEIYIREKSMLTVLTVYLAALFVIAEFGYKEGINKTGIDFVLLLLPAFIASGFGIILHQLRCIYTLGAYISVQEEVINSIIRLPHEQEINYSSEKYQLRYQKILDRFYGDWNTPIIIDAILMFISFFPILLLYLKGLAYVYNSIPPPISFFPEFPFRIINAIQSHIFNNRFSIFFWIYIIIFVIILGILIYFSTRRFSKKAENEFQRYNLNK